MITVTMTATDFEVLLLAAAYAADEVIDAHARRIRLATHLLKKQLFQQTGLNHCTLAGTWPKPRIHESKED